MPVDLKKFFSPERFAIWLRAGVFAFLAVAGVAVFPRLLNWTPETYLVASTLGVFAAAAVANAVVLRIYEQGRLADIGLGWSQPSRTNLLIGLAGGAAAAIAAVLVPVATRTANLARIPDAHPQWASVFFVMVVLLFGAIGEEMLFRGYAFQILLGHLGPFATILPFAVIFAWAHMGNPGQGSTTVSILAPVNTGLWGLLLGYAFLRSGDLWLPIGLHFGWNAVLPLLGANVSGLIMGLTGITLETRGSDIWTGGEYGPEGGLFTIFIVMALGWALYKVPVATQTPALVRPTEIVP
jgi:uncharacterized protein